MTRACARDTDFQPLPLTASSCERTSGASPGDFAASAPGSPAHLVPPR
jgi:hypothetical protein